MRDSGLPSTTHGSVAYLVTLCIVLVLPLAFINHLAGKQVVVKASAQSGVTQIITPTPTSAGVSPADSQPEQVEITNFVKQTFGKDAGNALRVLSCENHVLNPRAVNDNTIWGGRGIDKGLFQINTSWQGVTNDNFLYDYKINTLMAKKIFDQWGHNFQAWTCGKRMGL